MSNQTEFVTDRQWDGYARRLMKANLKAKHVSLTQIGISGGASSYIVEIRSDQKGMIVRTGWREAMKEKAQS